MENGTVNFRKSRKARQRFFYANLHFNPQFDIFVSHDENLVHCRGPTGMKWMISCFVFALLPGFLESQENHVQDFQGSASRQVVFMRHPAETFGFDDFYLRTGDELPAVINGKNGFRYIIPSKSVSPVHQDIVYARLVGIPNATEDLVFLAGNDTNKLSFRFISNTLVELVVPAAAMNYEIAAWLKGELAGKLDVIVYPELEKELILVPTLDFPVDPDTLAAELHTIFKGANISFKITLLPKFQPAGFTDSTFFDSPDTLLLRGYTEQMFRLSHLHEQNTSTPAAAYCLFIIPGFEDSLIRGYMGIGNHTGFVVENKEKTLAQSIADQLARGIGFTPHFRYQVPNENISPESGVLSFWDWEQMRSGEASHITWVERNKLPAVGGVVAYYFWEEMTGGIIVEKSAHSPFKSNFSVSFSKSQPAFNQPIERLEYAVDNLIDDNRSGNQKSAFEIRENGIVSKFQVPLRKQATADIGSVIFRKRAGKWESIRVKNVLYFNVLNDSVRQFSHANDSLILIKYNIEIPANGHYIVKTFWKNNGRIDKQEVFAYNGENVTGFFLTPERIIPKRILIFSNGYRGPDKDSDVSDNLVTTKDRYTYWMGIDKEFIRRRKPFETYYIDGNHGISTSSHRSKLNFGLSIAIVKTFATKDYYRILNTKPNETGFRERREKGKIAGKAFLITRCNSPACMETIDTVDIVCHSMGYAYALGFIDALKGKVVFGKIYIIAPETACLDGTDWSMFEEVWQYGSNLDQPDPDPVWEQDGIAPQCQVKGLEKLPPDRGGRAFIPKDWPIKNFIDSHMLFNYFWMFERISPGQPGYVKEK